MWWHAPHEMPQRLSLGRQARSSMLHKPLNPMTGGDQRWNRRRSLHHCSWASWIRPPWRYEVIRSLVLFADRTAQQRAQETHTYPDTVRTLQRRFRQQGMRGLLPAASHKPCSRGQPTGMAVSPCTTIISMSRLAYPRRRSYCGWPASSCRPCLRTWSSRCISAGMIGRTGKPKTSGGGAILDTVCVPARVPHRLDASGLQGGVSC
jgi:hypothetical protein